MSTSENQNLSCWQPQATWAIVIGITEWQDKELKALPNDRRYDAELVTALRDRGVPQSQIFYLKDREATNDAILYAMTQLTFAAPNEMLWFYYSGRGYKTPYGEEFFAPYDANLREKKGLRVAEIPSTIKRYFQGARVFCLADCAHSGALVQAIAQQSRNPAWCCLASSCAEEQSSQGILTKGAIEALRGDACVDGDENATISIRELAQSVRADIAFVGQERAAFFATPEFDTEIVLATALPKTGKWVGERVVVPGWWNRYKGRIIDESDDRFCVRYFDRDDPSEEWVEKHQIEKTSVPRELERESLAASAASTTGDRPESSYYVGQNVEVRWGLWWYPAKILAIAEGSYFIQYEDYNDDWNEWVEKKRLR